MGPPRRRGGFASASRRRCSRCSRPHSVWYDAVFAGVAVLAVAEAGAHTITLVAWWGTGGAATLASLIGVQALLPVLVGLAVASAIPRAASAGTTGRDSPPSA